MIIRDMYIAKRRFNQSLKSLKKKSRDFEAYVSIIQRMKKRTVHINLGVMRQPLEACYISELGFTTTNKNV